MANAIAAKTVVVADAAAHIRDRFRAAIEAAGHRAVGVRSAAELLGRVRADLPRIDLVVVDLRLPPADGVELVRRLRRLDGGRLPILVFSGTIVSAEEVRELASLGVAGYVNEHSDPANILPALAPHLFPDDFNRRHSPRVVVAIPVAFRIGETTEGAMLLNLGKGGVAIGTLSPLEASAKARIRFRLHGTGRELEAEARVVWTDGRAGMGLQFERVDAADQAAIDRYVDTHFFDGAPGGARF